VVKVLSKSGDSLADTYDVEGSIAGIEQLRSEEITLVHEMGATVFSERFSTFTRQQVTAAIGQSVDFTAIITNLPDFPTRLLGVSVISDDSSRVARASVAILDPGVPRDFPVWVWDLVVSLNIEIDIGSGQETLNILAGIGGVNMLPNFCGGVAAPQAAEQLVLRGRTTAFGAGTVVIRLLAHLAFAQVGGLSSRGLPIPGW